MPLSGPRIATAAETLVKTPSGKVGDISDSAFEQPAVVDFTALRLRKVFRIRWCSAEGFPCTR
jgi:hypothetical protein